MVPEMGEVHNYPAIRKNVDLVRGLFNVLNTFYFLQDCGQKILILNASLYIFFIVVANQGVSIQNNLSG